VRASYGPSLDRALAAAADKTKARHLAISQPLPSQPRRSAPNAKHSLPQLRGVVDELLRAGGMTHKAVRHWKGALKRLVRRAGEKGVNGGYAGGADEQDSAWSCSWHRPVGSKHRGAVLGPWSPHLVCAPSQRAIRIPTLTVRCSYDTANRR
jgi:hypothetical protein